MHSQDSNAFINEEGAIEKICASIGAGATLSQFCREHQPGLIFKLVSAWIAADEQRQKLYDGAVKIRDAHHKDEIVAQLYGMITADLTDAFTEEHAIKSITEIPEAVRHWIAGIEIEEVYEGRGEERRNTGRIVKIKFWDKVRSTELLMRNLSMLVDRKELDLRPGLAELLMKGS